MNPDTAGHAFQSTLGDLAHLFLDPSRLTVLNDSRVGSGGYGEVWLAKLDGSSRVIRIIPALGIGSRIATRLARELKIWAKVNHPNVLKPVGYYLSQNYDCAQLVSPYLENGNVIEYIRATRPSIQARLGFIRGITLGMAYLHGCDPPICHGDLKPANVLVNEVPGAVLCDFGLAKFVDDSGISSGLTTSRSIKGSLRYMSPEISDDEAKHSLESDIWAWACTTFEILTDVIPYATRRNDRGIMGAVLQGEPPASMDLLSGFAQKFDIPSRSTFFALQTLIPECWSGNPEDRPSSSRIFDRLTSADSGNRDQPPTQAPEGISQDVKDIGRCLSEDCERGLGTVLNHPTPENEQRTNNTNGRTNFGGS